MSTQAATNPHLASLQADIQSLRTQLADHPLYGKINSQQKLQLFMEHHVYAVWDFMSLLKYLQHHLTCTQAPWVPKSTAELRFFINEIVLGEESDEDPTGGHISHFELYKRAMQEAGASFSSIDQVVMSLQNGQTVSQALTQAQAPASASAFVASTFEIISRDRLHEVAAAFAFGREDLIPDMFLAMVKELNANDQQFNTFIYYLERHIELDGDHHAGLSALLLSHVCGDDAQKWAQASATAQEALRARIALWDGIAAQL
ncbi:MAG: DUF3050 domain-containing protein [Bacteroidota bacterium]